MVVNVKLILLLFLFISEAPRSNVENQLEHLKHLVSMIVLRKRAPQQQQQQQPEQGQQHQPHSRRRGWRSRVSRSITQLYNNGANTNCDADLSEALLHDTDDQHQHHQQQEQHYHHAITMDVDAAGPRCQFSWDVMEAICNLHSKLLKNYIAYAA